MSQLKINRASDDGSGASIACNTDHVTDADKSSVVCHLNCGALAFCTQIGILTQSPFESKSILINFQIKCSNVQCKRAAATLAIMRVCVTRLGFS